MQSPANIRMVELDPATGCQKRKWQGKPSIRTLRLDETPKVQVLLKMVRSKVPFISELLDLSFSIAYYADNLNRTLAGELLPKGDTVLHSGEDFQVGELSAAEAKRASINAVCGGCIHDILQCNPWRAVDRLKDLSRQLGKAT